MALDSKVIIGALVIAVLGAGGYVIFKEKSRAGQPASAGADVKGAVSTTPVAEGNLVISCSENSVVSNTSGHQASTTKEEGAIYTWNVTGGTIEGITHLDNISWAVGDVNEVKLSCKVSRKDGTEAFGSLRIKVQRAPVLSRFSATPEAIRPGDKVQLSWDGKNIQSLVLNPGGQDVTSVNGATYEVKPSETTTYSLMATSREGITATLNTTVKVVPDPVINALTSQPAGEGSVTVTAVFTGGKAVLKNGDAILASGDTSPLSVQMTNVSAGTVVGLSVSNEMGVTARTSITFAQKNK